ncbi:MAG: AI-2E family transporter [Peptococcaceae bacterium]|nr:AI-2E family transporter [Peptococcaceae bacterium]
MKLDFTRGTRNRMLANLLVVLAGLSFYFAMLNFDTISGFVTTVLDILRPFVYGFVLAFLLNSPVKYFDRVLGNRIKNKKLVRAISVAITMVLFFLVIGLLIAVLVPQLMESVVMLIKNIQDFATNLEGYVTTLMNMLQKEFHLNSSLYQNLADAWEKILALGSSLLLSGFQGILGLTGQVTTWVLDFFVALIVCVYLLMSKENFFAQIRKVLYAFFKKTTVDKILYVGNLTSVTFNGFIIGKLIDSLIIGILAFICLSILNMPYVLLVSVIIGVTNIIPFFGPFIGVIPSTFIILIVDPMQAVWFMVFILILQQIDGNIIGPRILGNTTGLPAIWVMFAILVGGGLAGFVGMIAGVPTMAVLYTLFRAYVKQRLEQKDLPSETEEYLASGVNPYQMKGDITNATESVRSDS